MGKRNAAFQKRQPLKEPGVAVREAVPHQVRGNPHQHCGHNLQKTSNAAHPERPHVRGDAPLQGFRKQCHCGPLHESVKHPQSCKTHRQAQPERARNRVSPTAARSQANKVLKIGCESTDHQGRRNKMKSSQRQSCGSMGRSKGHDPIIALRAQIAVGSENRRGSSPSQSACL